MTQTVPFGGKDLRVKRLTSPTDNAPVFLGTITTKGLTKTNEFDDATRPDNDNPDATWDRSSVKKSKSWSINISGVADAKAHAQLDTDADSEVPLYYQFEIAKSAANGGGHWAGYVWYENLAITSDTAGVVKFTGQLRGEGKLTWTAATA